METLFAENYATARSAFASACQASKCQTQTYKNDQSDTNNSLELITDTARLGPERAQKVLVLISGTHGVEGFCGSACQLAALKLGLFDNLPPGVAVLMVHAINPYGFAHCRRVTEANVDLNRNCVTRFEIEELAQFNPAYEELNDALNPVEWRLEKPHIGFGEILDYIKRAGLEKFQEAVSIGQYRHARGLFYGGSKSTWSRLTLENIISTQLAETANVLVVDYHTGLGRPGRGEIISTHDPASQDYLRAVRIFGNDVKSTKPTKTVGSPDPAAKSVSADVHGSIDTLFKDAHKTFVTYVALEFGTVDVLDVLEALRADNWFYQRSNRNPELQKIIADEMRRAFYPNSEGWRQAVLHRSAEVVTRALAAIATTEP